MGLMSFIFHLVVIVGSFGLVKELLISFTLNFRGLIILEDEFGHIVM